MQDGIDFPGYGAKPALKALAVSRFDPAAGSWIETDGGANGMAMAAFTAATFNTWFQGPDHELRHGGLLRCLQEADADVIVLQETTVMLAERLLAAPWVRAAYSCARAPFRADAVPSHGLMLLSRIPVHKALLHPLRTHMGRNLLTAQALLNGAAFTFATVHLESMRSNADVRGEQLAQVFDVLRDAPYALLAGDFNFCSSWTAENARLEPGYDDAWAVLRPGEPGYTQDTDRNPMLALAKRERKQVRLDRILVRGRGKAGHWTVRDVRLLGTEPVSAAHGKIFPSDHFGLAAALHWET